RLRKEQVIELDGFADKSAQNLVDRIAASKKPALGRFLSALGIPQVGEATAEMLAGEFGSIEKLRGASEEDLRRVEGVGPSLARRVGVRAVAKLFQCHSRAIKSATSPCSRGLASSPATRISTPSS